MDLNDRVAIITGAGKGLGRAYAMLFAARGAAVVVNNRRHPGEADAETSAAMTVAAIQAAGGRAAANYADVTDPGSGEAMVRQALATFGRLDIVVANAAINRMGSFHKQGLDEFRRVFDAGFLGHLHLFHAAWPVLRAAGYGRVVATTSSAGLHGEHGMSAYAASKAAVLGLVRSLAIEGAPRGIAVNCIAPYAVTQMTRDHMSAAQAAGFPADLVAPFVGWLASAGCGVNGEVFVAGGGAFRRSYTGESETVLPGELSDAALAALGPRLAALGTLRRYARSTDAFASLARELKFDGAPPA